MTAHWLRRTTITWVERHYGYAIAQAYAGHSHDKDTALIYAREVAMALSAPTNEPHPLVASC
ncbi:hypothetical protein [Amycolatopsis pigmentata]|uniref:Phage integrase family protein n=1 Tax=Amycolatopsis pigmentata TaxID=450801 RepID=A0ABW5FP04_9PSEU